MHSRRLRRSGPPWARYPMAVAASVISPSRRHPTCRVDRDTEQRCWPRAHRTDSASAPSATTARRGSAGTPGRERAARVVAARRARARAPPAPTSIPRANRTCLPDEPLARRDELSAVCDRYPAAGPPPHGHPGTLAFGRTWTGRAVPAADVHAMPAASPGRRIATAEIRAPQVLSATRKRPALSGVRSLARSSSRVDARHANSPWPRPGNRAARSASAAVAAASASGGSGGRAGGAAASNPGGG